MEFTALGFRKIICKEARSKPNLTSNWRRAMSFNRVHILANAPDFELMQELHRAGDVPNWLLDNKKLRKKFFFDS